MLKDPMLQKKKKKHCCEINKLLAPAQNLTLVPSSLGVKRVIIIIFFFYRIYTRFVIFSQSSIK